MAIGSECSSRCESIKACKLISYGSDDVSVVTFWKDISSKKSETIGNVFLYDLIVFCKDSPVHGHEKMV